MFVRLSVYHLAYLLMAQPLVIMWAPPTKLEELSGKRLLSRLCILSVAEGVTKKAWTDRDHHKQLLTA
jgi:hypothetical protein